MTRTNLLVLAAVMALAAYPGNQGRAALAGDAKLRPVGSLNCRAGHTSLHSETAPAAGLTCLLTFDDHSPPLQFQGELYHPGFARSGTADRIITWRVLSDGGQMPAAGVAGEYEVRPGDLPGSETARDDVLIGGAENAIALEPGEPGLVSVAADTKLTLRMMLQWSRTAAVVAGR